MSKRTVAVDFDATLHPYTDGWVGYRPTDEPPIEGAGWFLRTLHGAGFAVVVFSARADTPEGKTGIEEWLNRNSLAQYIDEVTNVKPPAVAYVDDRAVPFTGDFEEALVGVMNLIATKELQ